MSNVEVGHPSPHRAESVAILRPPLARCWELPLEKKAQSVPILSRLPRAGPAVAGAQHFNI